MRKKQNREEKREKETSCLTFALIAHLDQFDAVLLAILQA